MCLSSDANTVLDVMKILSTGGARHNARGLARTLQWIRPGEGSYLDRINERRAFSALKELEKAGYVVSLVTGAGHRWKRIK